MEVPEVVVELTKITAIQQVLTIALNNNGMKILLIFYIIILGVVKGVAETVKALERQEVKIIFMASDCDNDQYKDLVVALAKQYQVPVVEVPTWIELKDLCKLGYASETIIKMAEDKKKEPKIKPRCSVSAIVVNYIINLKELGRRFSSQTILR